MPFFSADQLKFLHVIPGEAFKPAFQTFRHSLHQHELTLRELSPLCNSVLCAGCESLIQGPTYCCDDCNYYLHISCAELPLQAPFPLLHDQEHPLALTEVKKKDLLRPLESTRALCYSCKQCRWNCHLDIVLSIMPCNGNDVVGEFSSFFAHKHPLRRFIMKEKIYDEHCDGCRGKATGELYGCIGCRFYLHKRCFELLLREIRHPLHPDHPLKPVDMNRGGECGCCHRRSSLGYSCDECGFFIDLRCADMTLCFEDYMKEATEAPTPIRYPMHNHELTKFSIESWGEMILCQACDRKLSEEVYGCRECLYFLHKECAEMPPQIRHYLHPKHPLTLGYPHTEFYHQCNGCGPYFLEFEYDGDGDSDDKCRSCGGSLFGLGYMCNECFFYLHVKCTLRTLSLVEQGSTIEIQHPVYRFSMNLVYSRRQRCYACGEVIIGPSYLYNDGDIREFLHRSCAELSLDLRHPFHPMHPLSLRAGRTHGLEEFQCKACLRTKYTGFAYLCGVCGFYLCVPCSSLELTFKHHLHNHKLAYFGQTEHLMCSLCHKGCNADLYRCVRCNFNLHQDCLPLPGVVKSPHNMDHLVLYQKVIEDDSGEYYCDICEQRRDPDEGAFYCAPCKMITDIKCVLPMVDVRVRSEAAIAEASERVKTLRAELEEVESRRADLRKKLEAAKELLASLSS